MRVCRRSLRSARRVGVGTGTSLTTPGVLSCLVPHDHPERVRLFPEERIMDVFALCGVTVRHMTWTLWTITGVRECPSATCRRSILVRCCWRIFCCRCRQEVRRHRESSSRGFVRRIMASKRRYLGRVVYPCQPYKLVEIRIETHQKAYCKSLTGQGEQGIVDMQCPMARAAET